MVSIGDGHLESEQTRRTDRRDYRFLLALAVSWFFVISVLTRLLPRGLRPFAASGPEHESCFEEARRMAHAVIPYAFEW
jgi:hypothetical protein